MSKKILHIFAPSFKDRFGGQVFTWKHVFLRWNDPDVVHYVLDFSSQQMLPAKDAFDFEYSNVQKATSRLERLGWIITLFKNLYKSAGKFDILHVHVLWWGGLLIGPWAKLMRIPAIYESVLLDADTPGAILKEKVGRLKIRLMKSYRAILAISEYLAEDYRKSGFSTAQVFTLMNSVDREVFFPVKSSAEKAMLRKKYNMPDNAMVLTFVGSIIKRKGVDLLVEAFAEASARCPDLHLLMVGPRNRSENPSLDEGFVNDSDMVLRKHGLMEKVSFLGLIQNRQELAEIYRMSDIFVFPSRNEGLGNVILEAMACELPVIVSQLPVLEKVVLHGENGFVVPIGSAECLRDAIITLVTEPGLAQKIGQNAYHYIEAKHSFYIWQNQLVNLYMDLLL